jgi:excinuclease ABC subunit C
VVEFVWGKTIILRMNSQDLKKFDLPDSPGVYFFYGYKKKLLYVGKATSLKDRVKSYFMKDLMLTRGPLLVKMLADAERVEWLPTDSVLEALLMEAHQIKKHKPEYNTRDKDDKSPNYVVITKEEFPVLKVIRGRNLSQLEVSSKNLTAIYGPFPHGGELREALKIIRRIFPYRDEKCQGVKAKRPCFNYQIGLCPGVCAGVISKTEYRKTVKRIKLFFEGKKSELIKDLEKDMKKLAKEKKFEEASVVKRTLYSLEHIQDVALIKRDVERVHSENVFRIEAYDIAHISGSNVVGVMTVVEDGELNKSQYRKFKIKNDRNDDTNNLKEVVRRRLGHPEWQFPSLIVVDGGVGQINAAKEVLKNNNLDIPVVSVVKDDKHKAREVLGVQGISAENPSLKKEILLANVEAHRFAITYHRKLRSKGFRI